MLTNDNEPEPLPSSDDAFQTQKKLKRLQFVEISCLCRNFNTYVTASLISSASILLIYSSFLCFRHPVSIPVFVAWNIPCFSQLLQMRQKPIRSRFGILLTICQLQAPTRNLNKLKQTVIRTSLRFVSSANASKAQQCLKTCPGKPP